MRIAIAGATGFLGTTLVEALVARGHHAVVLTRRPADTPPWCFGHGDPARVRVTGWTPDRSDAAWAATLDGVDVVCNLAGASIGEGRWTAARKRTIRDSRVAATRSLVAAAAAAATPPRLFLNASAVGYYGSRGDEVLTEEAPPGDDFLARVSAEWEAAAHEADGFTRVVTLRSGIVLDAAGGALPRMAFPFRLFAGGRLGSGRQYVSWIHRTDWIRLAVWLVEHPEVSGPVNATAPEPVPNRVFATALGKALGRPSVLPAPAFALRVILGRERANTLLLASQRVVPARARDHGFDFRYPTIAAALGAIYGA